MTQPISPIEYNLYSPGRWQTVQGSAIVERTVSLTVNNEVWLSFMCTPLDLEAMAVGFLYNEGLLDRADEIADVRLCASGDNVDVWTHKNLAKPERWSRTSGCTGGATSVESEVKESDPPIRKKAKPASMPALSSRSGIIRDGAITPQQLSGLVSELFDGQSLYREAGGVHSSALSDGRNIMVSAEDIGRHNTLDKIAGHCLMKGIHIPNSVVISTGRISSEMLQKASRLEAAVVVSRTAASSLAIQMALELGITLIGYARRDRFNVYTHPERIVVPDLPRST